MPAEAPQATTPSDPPTRISLRAFIGLAIFGLGLSTVLEIVPHEDPWVGAALLAFGIALFVTAPSFPQVGTLPAWPIAVLGVLCIMLGTLSWATHGSSLNAPKWALVVLGAILLAAAPFLGRWIRVPWRDGRHIGVSTLVACAAAALGAPLLVWGLQALFKTVVGSTPVETFTVVALVAPMRLVLTLFGWSPIQDGQSLTYAGQDGPIRVDIGAACSGVQAMVLFTAVLALYVITQRPKGPAAALWSAIGILGVYATNLVRLVVLVIIGHLWGVAALLRAHAELGWMFFVAWAILFAALARLAAPRPTP